MKNPLICDLDGYQLVRLSHIFDGDIIVDPDTGDKRFATLREYGMPVYVDDQGREAGGKYVYRKITPVVAPDFPAGWQNVRAGFVCKDDLLIWDDGDRMLANESDQELEIIGTGECPALHGQMRGGCSWGACRVYRKVACPTQTIGNDQAQYLKAPESKHTNPKDAIGSGKLPLDLVPETAVAYMALAFLEGGLKYGAHNYRAIGVRSSIYYAACRRHLMKWWNGEWQDAKTGVPHLASAAACIAIILDADSMKKLTDDRPPANPGLVALIDQLGDDQVKRLKELFKNENPKHWTIKDTP